MYSDHKHKEVVSDTLLGNGSMLYFRVMSIGLLSPDALESPENSVAARDDL